MISYSTANFLLGRVSIAAPYWGAFGIDIVALAVAGYGSRRLLARPSHPVPSISESARSRSR